MKYRNSTQIATTILEATKEVGRDGINVTGLMAKSNMPYPRLSKLIDKLIGNGLINKIKVENGNTFVITEKGMLYLEEYRKFQDLAESFGMEL